MSQSLIVFHLTIYTLVLRRTAIFIEDFAYFLPPIGDIIREPLDWRYILPLYDKFEDIEVQIETIACQIPEQTLVELNERESFQNLYFDLISKAKSYLTAFTASGRLKGREVEVYNPKRAHITLHSLTGQSLYRNSMALKAFSDAFDALIHLNAYLSVVQKHRKTS